MRPPPTEDTARAIRCAESLAARWGQPAVAPEHLLLGLLQVPECTAVRLLERLEVSVNQLRDRVEASLVRTESIAWAEVWHSEASKAAQLRAQEEARERKASLTATEHLLLGVLAGGGAASAALEALGAGARSVSSALFYFDGEADDGIIPPRTASDSTTPGFGRPAAVTWVSLAMLLNLICGVMPILASLRPGFLSEADWLIAAYLWSWLVSVLLVRPVYEGYRWAWSGAVGVLFVKTAGALGIVVLLAGQMSSHSFGKGAPGDLAWVLLIPGGLAGLLAALLWGMFQARGWYGVPRRQGWRALLREGWWALLVTGVLDLGAVLSSQLR